MPIDPEQAKHLAGKYVKLNLSNLPEQYRKEFILMYHLEDNKVYQVLEAVYHEKKEPFTTLRINSNGSTPALGSHLFDPYLP